MKDKMPRVQIYTDGACSGNPGPGGYGAILKYGKMVRELSGGYRLTTNNRMELMGIVKSLAELKKPCRVDLYSDSRYVVDAFRLGWVNSWLKNGWVKGDRSPVKNADLWKKIIELSKRHEINWIWVRGHSDNEFNSRCDRLAVEASRGDRLAVDSGYEES